MHLHAHACMCRCMYMCIMYVIDTSQVLINSWPFSIKYCKNTLIIRCRKPPLLPPKPN